MCILCDVRHLILWSSLLKQCQLSPFTNWYVRHATNIKILHFGHRRGVSSVHGVYCLPFNCLNVLIVVLSYDVLSESAESQSALDHVMTD